MAKRILVAGTGTSPATTQVEEQIANILATEQDNGAGTTATVDALAGQPLAAVLQHPARALNEIVVSLRSTDADTLLITGLAGSPAPSFDVLGWNLQVAANVGATFVGVVDATGMSSDLLGAEVSTLERRAQQAHAHLGGVVVTGTRGTDLGLAIDGVPAVATPVTADKLQTLTAGAKIATTPLMFETELLSLAASNPQTIVLPEPEDDRILRATAELTANRVAKIVLVGDPGSVRARADQLGLNLGDTQVVSPSDPQLVEKYAGELAKIRAAKGLTIDQARAQVQEPTYFATMMVQMGDADGMVSGATHTTANTIVPAFQIIKTAPGVSAVSSVFFMLLADKVLVMGDCAVTPNPTPDQLAQIAVSSAETAAQFGIDPRVALLSYSTGSSGSGPDVDAVTAATEKAQALAPQFPIEGPLQYDAAVDAAVAASKAPDSDVAGTANVLIFPNLNAGNIAYKAVQRSAGAVAIGPVLQGLRRPVNDLSRGAEVEDIIHTVAITAVQAQTEGK